MALITLERLKSKLNWQRVFDGREEAGYAATDGPTCYMRTFTVRPERDNLPYITLFFDDSVSSFGPFCFGPWHWDPYSPTSEPGKVRAAILLTQRLMSHYFCIAEDLNAAGISCGVGLYRPNEIPKTLDKNITQSRRWFFGKDSEIVPVDFSRYVDGGPILLERGFDAQVKRGRRKAQKMLDEQRNA